MGTLLFQVGFVALFLSGIAAFWWFSPDQRARRLLRSTPATPASEARPGQHVKITGRVRLLADLEAPLSGAQCAYWYIRIEAPQRKNGWHRVAEDSAGTAFLVDDGSGEVVHVEPYNARVVVDTGHAGETGTFDNASAAEAELLRRYGVSATVLGFNRRFRFTEGMLRAGEQVSVHGEVTLQEKQGRTRLALVAPRDGQLVISDDRGVHG